MLILLKNTFHFISLYIKTMLDSLKHSRKAESGLDRSSEVAEGKPYY